MSADAAAATPATTPAEAAAPKSRGLPQPEPSSTRFAGKYCIVTGASKGIGFAIAVRLAREGGHVCIHYGRDKAGAERTAATIKDYLAKDGIEEERTVRHVHCRGLARARGACGAASLPGVCTSGRPT